MVQRTLFAVGLALVLGCGTPTTVTLVGQDLADQAQQQAADQEYNEQTHAEVMLPAEPAEGVDMFVDRVQTGGPTVAKDLCAIFTSQAQAQLAAAQHAEDCVSAVERLSTEVTDAGVYVNDLRIPPSSWRVVGPFAVVNGCAVYWIAPFSDLFSDPKAPPPGPRPGRWVMLRVFGDRWEIASYRPC